MGFLSDFLGKSQKRDVEMGTMRAESRMKRGYANARQDLEGGYNTATGNLANARNALMHGRDAARTTQDGYLSRATGYLEPQIGTGNDAMRRYRAGLGLDGADAQRGFVQEFQGDPFRDFNEQRVSNALMRRFGAAGMGDSGASRLAVARANLESGTQDYQTYLSRLQQLAAQGGQYASQAAGLTAQAGGQQAGMDYGTGGQVAGVYGNQAGMDYGYGGQQAGYDIGEGQGLAASAINEANAIAASRTAGINNVMNAAGMVMQGMTPGLKGASPFGSGYNALMRGMA